MSSPTPSDISQNNAEILVMQQQQLLLQLEEAVKLCQAECMAQKARREAEKKAREEAERQRIAEKKKKKKKTLEYLQWLWDKVLEKEAALLKKAEGSQIMESKYKEIATRDEEGQQLPKKTKGRQQGKYHGGAAVKIRGTNPCKRCISARQDCLVYYSR